MFDYLDAYYDILDEMEREMTTGKQTASISRNFITQMIPHHRAAVEMCENALRYTVSEPVILKCNKSRIFEIAVI